MDTDALRVVLVKVKKVKKCCWNYCKACNWCPEHGRPGDARRVT